MANKRNFGIITKTKRIGRGYKMSRFDKLLLSEMRTLESRGSASVKNVDLETQLERALADNENLKALGYQLKAEAIVRLAADYQENEGMTPLYKRVMELEPAIEVDPMYPNFPTQVLEMDELEFRTHQIIHYLTTYGVEELLGVEVKEGWLPKTEEIEEREEDILVADLKTLDYLSSRQVDELVINSLIGRKERLLPKEIELAKEVVIRTDLPIKNVPFKENIGAIFGDLLLTGSLEDRYKTLKTLANVMKHPGDVLDLTEYMVVQNNYKHLKTSVKRGLVELIEQFSAGAIEENLASNRWSNKFLGKGGKARSINRNIALIDYLSFNRFSKSDTAKNLVAELKSGLLKSWNQKLEQAYKEKDYEAVLDYLSQRPGVMFRQVNRLVKLGVDSEAISSLLKESSADLKTQTIVSALNNFDGDDKVKDIFMEVLINNLANKEMEIFKDKKIYLEEDDVALDKSSIEITDKFVEGGYITNGIAVRIPESAQLLRFFTYWNDKRHIDIDLHGVTVDKDGDIEHVGWNGAYKNKALVHSGDITHSDAAEYIDLDLTELKKNGIDKIQFNINSYTGVPFSKIETVFTGLMAVSELREQVDLFDSKNVIFRHDLENNSMAIDYAVIDVENNIMKIIGETSDRHNNRNIVESLEPTLSIQKFIGILILTQGGTIVDDKEKADLVVGLAKADKENYVSLLDENFFMDEK